jgi:hypothetical protein
MARQVSIAVKRVVPVWRVVPKSVRRLMPQWLGRPIGTWYRDTTRRFVLSTMPKGAICAEIGVWRGDFSAQILEQTRPSQLHLVDQWQVAHDDEHKENWYGSDRISKVDLDDILHSVEDRFSDEIEAGRMLIHRAPSTDTAGKFPDGHFDWIYVDADHTYEGVQADLKAWVPKVIPGGLIAGDDYDSAGVGRAVRELVETGVGEFVAVRDGQFILKKRPGAGFR